MLIIFIILLVLVLIIFAAIGVTVYQIAKTKEKVDAFAKEANAFRENCTDAEGLKESAYALRGEIISACKNPLIKWFAEKNIQEGICEQVFSESYVNSTINEIQQNCESIVAEQKNLLGAG